MGRGMEIRKGHRVKLIVCMHKSVNKIILIILILIKKERKKTMNRKVQEGRARRKPLKNFGSGDQLRIPKALYDFN